MKVLLVKGYGTDFTQQGTHHYSIAVMNTAGNIRAVTAGYWTPELALHIAFEWGTFFGCPVEERN